MLWPLRQPTHNILARRDAGRGSGPRLCTCPARPCASPSPARRGPRHR